MTDEHPRDLLVCAACGATAAGWPLTWVSSTTDGSTRWYCERCSRANLRSIEARLDEQWWS